MSGYRDCACRDCFEIAIGDPGAVRWECKEAGCEGANAFNECQRPGAYGDEGENLKDGSTIMCVEVHTSGDCIRGVYLTNERTAAGIWLTLAKALQLAALIVKAAFRAQREQQKIDQT